MRYAGSRPYLPDMTEPPGIPPSGRSAPPYQRWFAELKRRQVFRVIAVYGAGSLVVLESADLIAPLTPLPAWTVNLVFWLALLGFPLAIGLSWFFDLTTDGLKRMEVAAPGEIDAIVAAPAFSRWVPGLFALGGLGLFAIGFYGGTRSSAGLADEGAATAVDELAGPDLTYPDLDTDPRPAIAVLPFADMSPDQDQQYFSDGISEEILTVLSRIRNLRVAARSSAFVYRTLDLDLRQVGQELGVPYLLAGSVRKAGDELRITAELVDAADNSRLWSETYDRRLENVFVIQSEIAESITEALRVPMGLNNDALVSPTLDMAAYDLYLSGRAAMRRRGPGIGEAIQLFEAAITLDSVWAPAWAALAEARAINPLYTDLGGESSDSTFWATSLEAAEAAARRALALDPRNSSASVALGGVHRDRWEWADGERELLRAIEIDPDDIEAHIQYAELLWGMGRLDESLRETGRSLTLDRTPLTLDIHGFALYMNRRYDEAEAMLEEGIAMDAAGDMHFLRTVLANLLLVEGRYREAVDRFAEYLPDPEAYRLLGEALEQRDAGLVPNASVRGRAQTLMLLGEPDRALDALKELVLALPFRVMYDIWDPVLAPLHGTEVFQEVILPRLKLVGAEAEYAEDGGR